MDNTAKPILDYNNSLHNYLNENKDLSSSFNTVINNGIQNNQDEINKINESLKPQTQLLQNGNSTIKLIKSNGIVQVECNFINLNPNESYGFFIPEVFEPKIIAGGM
ncbi:hypothetical protein ACWCL1_02345 [Ligilactobacillus sp. LYQ135]